MSKINEAEIRRRLELLAQAQPSPQATERALDRVRQTLTQTERPQARKSIWRIVMENRWSKLAVAAAVILAVAMALNVIPIWPRQGVAWSQLLEKVQQASSCIHRMRMTVVREDGEMVLEGEAWCYRFVAE